MIKRLNDHFSPKNYDLHLKIDKEAMVFSGSVTITGELKTSSSVIELHGKDLEFSYAKIDTHDAEWVESGEHDEIQIKAHDILPEGSHVITLEFAGKITDNMHGIYPCYFEHEGKKKKLIATQFESHHAREVFPCVDEPEAKATFDVTLETDEGEEVLGNMPVKKHSDADGIRTTQFEQTPIMSTYLLAFVAGEMHYKEAKTKDGVVVRSWATVAQPDSHLQYSVNETVKILEFYNDYFETPYPLPKCDQVALPDFESAAMENWGLITYREVALLADPKNRSLSSEQYIFLVIAHELSHQWFGNLVTMKWWDDLWLNESFASIIEYVALDAIHPEWHMWESYTVSDAVFASSRDVFSKVQPVGVDVHSPEEISSLFDPAIVYAKGSRLLKMLREFIGEDAFRSALKNYFKKFAYQNTTRDDLWDEFSLTSKVDISSMMSNWLERSGMPVVTVDQRGNKLTLTQDRLLLDKPEVYHDTIWHIPLLADKQLKDPLLSHKETSTKSEDNGYVVLNQNGSGHYVSNYMQTEHVQALADKLASCEISAESRITLLNDQILLARAGTNSLTTALKLVKNMSDEPRHSVWDGMSMIIGHARTLTEGDKKAKKLLQKFTKSLALKLHEELGWENDPKDDANTVHLRNSMIGMMLGSEDKATIENAKKLFEKHGAEELPSELRAMILSTMVKQYDKECFDDLVQLYKTTNSSDLQNDICSALASTKSERRAKELAAILTDTNTVRPQDIFRWFAYLMRNRYTRETTWEWMVENWAWIEVALGSGKSYDYFPLYGARFVSTKEWLKKYKDFFEPKRSVLALERNIDVGIDEIEAKIAWRKRDEAKIKAWLQKNV